MPLHTLKAYILLENLTHSQETKETSDIMLCHSPKHDAWLVLSMDGFAYHQHLDNAMATLPPKTSFEIIHSNAQPKQSVQQEQEEAVVALSAAPPITSSRDLFAGSIMMDPVDKPRGDRPDNLPKKPGL